MKTKETIEKLKNYQMKLAIQSSPHATLEWDDRHGLHKSLEDTISLLESMGKDGEMLEFIRRKSKVVKADSTRTLIQIELPVAPSFREAITTAMKNHA